MELGEKIKQARLDKGLSQRQLCADVITRNMLSQIENGSARPSMDTLRYFAQRLEKPVSWFLEEQTVTSPNEPLMRQLRQLLASADHGGILSALENYRSPDPVFDAERYLLEAQSLTQQARRALAEHKPVLARQLLERARQVGQQTVYYTPEMEREWLLCMYQAAPYEAQTLAAQLPVDDRALWLRAEAALAQEDPAQSARYLDAVTHRDARWHLQRGHVALAQKDYALAKDHYHQAEAEEPVACAQGLETCYRELEDYKMAYFYACKRREG